MSIEQPLGLEPQDLGTLRQAMAEMANPFIEHPAEHRARFSGGDQWLFRFPNGYGASVVRGPSSYGGLGGLWELAVIVWEGEGSDDFEITYDTPVTGDVLGWLTVAEVAVNLRMVAALPEPFRGTDMAELAEDIYRDES